MEQEVNVLRACSSLSFGPVASRPVSLVRAQWDSEVAIAHRSCMCTEWMSLLGPGALGFLLFAVSAHGVRLTLRCSSDMEMRSVFCEAL